MGGCGLEVPSPADIGGYPLRLESGDDDEVLGGVREHVAAVLLHAPWRRRSDSLEAHTAALLSR